MILAIDPSLTATGYARGLAGGFPELGTLSPPKAAAKGIERLIWIRDQMVRLSADCDLVIIEGYSFASRGRAIISLGELGGVLRVALTERGVPYVEAAPSARAKYATGKGNAGKEEVLAAAIRRLGYAGHDNNEADALWLWAMTADAYGGPPAEMPKTNRAALEAIDWPDFPALHSGGGW